MTDSAQVAAALDAVERAELPSLMWGLVDQTLSEDRVLDAIASADGSSTPDALMAELLRRGLIFDVPRTSPPRYRSRMAEGIDSCTAATTAAKPTLGRGRTISC